MHGPQSGHGAWQKTPVRSSASRTIDQRDYAIPATALTFRLAHERTRVVSELTIERRPGAHAGTPLELDGDGLNLVSLEIDGVRTNLDDVEVSPDRLTLKRPPATRRFTLKIETELAPSANRALMGLYRSNGVYCTQCEAEGFRRITYFLDRPDVLSTYRVRIEADAEARRRCCFPTATR